VAVDPSSCSLLTFERKRLAELLAEASPLEQTTGGPTRIRPPRYADAAMRTPSSRIICSRMANFCGLPVAVVGNSGTNRM